MEDEVFACLSAAVLQTHRAEQQMEPEISCVP